MRILATLLMIFYCIPAFGQSKKIELSELGRPAIFIINQGRIFVLEKATIYIYSLKDFSLIKKFGREGEGPKEFITRPFGPPMSMCLYKDHLAINSMNKVSFFTQDGEFVRLVKTKPNLVFYPINNSFLVVGPAIIKDNQTLICFQLMDSNLMVKKMLLETDVDVNFQYISLPMSALTYRPFNKDKIFLSGDISQFVIDVYDFSGKKLYQIKKEESKIKITEKYKKYVHDWFSKDPQFKGFYPNFKDNIFFKKYYPILRDLHVTDDTICAITHQQKEGKSECIFMDLKGNEQKRLYVPLAKSIPFTYYPLLYTIHNGQFYTLIENEDEETWELNILDLKK